MLFRKRKLSQKSYIFAKVLLTIKEVQTIGHKQFTTAFLDNIKKNICDLRNFFRLKLEDTDLPDLESPNF